MKITIGQLKKLIKESTGQVLSHVSLDELHSDYPEAANAMNNFIGEDWVEVAERGELSFEIRDFHGMGDGGELVLTDHDQQGAEFVWNGDTWEEVDPDTILAHCSTNDEVVC